MQKSSGKYSIFEEYELIKTLGQGGFGKVKLGRHIETRDLVAIKFIRFREGKNPDQLEKDIIQETKQQMELKHKNIVNVIKVSPNGVYLKKNSDIKTQKFGIILEYAATGELFDIIAHSGNFSDSMSRYYFNQLIDGLKYIHDQGYSHRDLKPENILFDKEYNLKIADFGFTTLTEKNRDGLLYTNLGTDGYKCPEMYDGKAYKGENFDVFAAGVILFIMRAGHPPFKKGDVNKDPHYKAFATNNEKFWKVHKKMHEEGFYTPEYIEFVNSILAYKNRLSLSEIQQQKWYNLPKPQLVDMVSDLHKRRQVTQEKIRLEKEQEKLEKQKQKNQQQIYQGQNKFRSGEEGEEDVLASVHEQCPDLKIKNKRQIYHYDSNDFEIDHQFQIYKSAQEVLGIVALNLKQLKMNEISADENKFKFKITKFGSEEKEEQGFVVSAKLYQCDEESVYVDLIKQSGSAHEFNEFKQELVKIMNK